MKVAPVYYMCVQLYRIDHFHMHQENKELLQEQHLNAKANIT